MVTQRIRGLEATIPSSLWMVFKKAVIGITESRILERQLFGKRHRQSKGLAAGA